MKFDKFVRKASMKIVGELIKPTTYINHKLYKKLHTRYLKSLGVKITGTPMFIARTVYFDGFDYSLIEIGHNTTISGNVTFLTHDSSPYVAFDAAGYEAAGLPRLDKIHVGKNSFIGMNSTLLQGTHIGDYSIVGAGSVVKGKFPDGVIIAGNPGRVVANTVEWIDKKIVNDTTYRDFLVDPKKVMNIIEAIEKERSVSIL